MTDCNPLRDAKLKVDPLYHFKTLVDPYYDIPLARVEDTPYGMRIKPLEGSYY